MEKLILGVDRFRRTAYAENQTFFEQIASAQQRPMALFITCADSRINPNLITQTEPGDLFLIRNAGNIVPPYGAVRGGEAATIEYSVEILGIRDIVICGHSQCGAMAALLGGGKLEHVPAVRAWCAHAEATRRIVEHKYAHLPPEQLARAAIEENVLVQMQNLSTHPCVAARQAAGELRVHGWHYDIGLGRIDQYEHARGCFVELSGEAGEPYSLRLRTGT